MASPPDENLFAEERRMKILSLLGERKKLQVTELVEQLGVSATTVRMDLRDLEAANLLLRTHGGAIERPSTGFESALQEREIQNREAKRLIAQAALEQIRDGDTIILDTGTTTKELARLLHQRKRITVVTNDLLIAGVVEEFPSIEIVLIGGLIRRGFHCSVGFQGRIGFEGLTVDKGFFGANGFSIETGATTPDISQAQIKRRMIEMAQKVYLLCDHSKMGHTCFARFADLHDIDAIITDTLDSPKRDQLEELGIQVTQAGRAAAINEATNAGEMPA
jgi:DeoR family fructose operon transcriptional repressor